LTYATIYEAITAIKTKQYKLTPSFDIPSHHLRQSSLVANITPNGIQVFYKRDPRNLTTPNRLELPPT
jgi:hypothetical protein